MSSLTKLEFIAFDINSDDYLSWVFDAEIYLDTMNIEETIKEINTTLSQEKAKAMIFFSTSFS